MGNTVVWKPASSAMLSGYYTLQAARGGGPAAGRHQLRAGRRRRRSPSAAVDSPDLAGVHFTGSTGVFNSMWKTIGENIGRYRTYPRIVGETGGKDFIVAHPSADPSASRSRSRAAASSTRARSARRRAASTCRESLWSEVRDRTVAMMEDIKMGDVRDFRNFMGAVIDKKAFNKISELPRRREAEREDRAGRRREGRRGLLHRADAGRDRRIPATARCARRSSDRS